MGNALEGELFRSFEIEGVRFDIYYGYESDSVRLRGWEPTPQYPDLLSEPIFTPKGQRFCLTYLEACERFDPISPGTERRCCATCRLFDRREEYVGICRCELK